LAIHLNASTVMDILLAGQSNFDYENARVWIRERRNWGLQVVAAYLLTLFMLKKWMEKRQPYNLQLPLILWNVGLTVFSIGGFYYTTKEMLLAYNTFGFHGTYCKSGEFFRGVTGYWVWLFTVSKMFELGDSYFLVLRKRPLIFLQWYHHALTLLYCWYSYDQEPSFNRWGCWMNYGVHSFMYSYFLLRALKISLPNILGQMVTYIQIVQFIMSTTLITHGMYRVYFENKQCDWPWAPSLLATAMNLSYLYLFCDFFYRSYIRREHRRYADKPTKTE